MSVLEGTDWRSCPKDGLRERAVVEVDVAQDVPRQVLSALEEMALKDVLDPAVEASDHAVCLWLHRRREAMPDAEVGAEPAYLVLPGGAAFAQAKQAVGEGLSVIGWALTIRIDTGNKGREGS